VFLFLAMHSTFLLALAGAEDQASQAVRAARLQGVADRANVPGVPRAPGALGPASSAAVDEADLLAALRRGEEAAYETLVRREGPRLLAVARGLLQDEQEAQDALQEAFFKAFGALEGFEGKSRLGTWLHRIVVNAALMRLRRRARKPMGSIEELLPAFRADGHPEHPAMPWSEPADAAAMRHEVRELVRDSIERLPDNYRNAVRLADIEGLSIAEIAEIHGVTPNAIKIRLHRARMALRELLDPILRSDMA
jgi:RNA polymerase sigma-70 factor (ECF subfamily)